MGVNVNAWVGHEHSSEALFELPHQLDISCPSSRVWFWADNCEDGRWSYEVSPTADAVREGVALLDGPGILIHIQPRIMQIWCLARWRDFLADDELRSKVRSAIEAVSQVLGAAEIVWLPDWADGEIRPSEANGVLTMDTVLKYLHEKWGSPEPWLEHAPDRIVEEAAGSMQLWLMETISKDA